MEPCIVVWLVAVTNKMQLSNGILLFHGTLMMYSNSQKMVKLDRNMSELRQILCENVILTLVH